MRLVRKKDFKLINDIQDYIFEYLKNKFLKSLNVSNKIIKVINTVMSLDGFMILTLLLKKFGYAYLINWLFWLSLI